MCSIYPGACGPSVGSQREGSPHLSLCALENGGHLNSSEVGFLKKVRGVCNREGPPPRSTLWREPSKPPSPSPRALGLLRSARDRALPKCSLGKWQFPPTNNMTFNFTQNPHLAFEGQRSGCVFYFINGDKRIAGMWRNAIMPAL